MKLEFEKGKVPEHVFTEVQDLAAKYFLYAQKSVLTSESGEQGEAISLCHYVQDHRDTLVGSGVGMIRGSDCQTAYDIMDKTESELIFWAVSSHNLDDLAEITITKMVDAMTMLTPEDSIRTDRGYSRVAGWVADGIAKRADMLFKKSLKENPVAIESMENCLVEVLRKRIPDDQYSDAMARYTRVRVPKVEVLLWTNAETRYNEAVRGKGATQIEAEVR